MAVDTRQKRFSIVNSILPSIPLPSFEADGSVDADDRAFLLNLYSGISLASLSLINTREKRASVVSFLLCNYGQGVTPQAGFPQSERQAVLWIYSGILAATTAEELIANFILLNAITQMRAGRT
jgi:hypothetical protein